MMQWGLIKQDEIYPACVLVSPLMEQSELFDCLIWMGHKANKYNYFWRFLVGLFFFLYVCVCVSVSGWFQYKVLLLMVDCPVDSGQKAALCCSNYPTVNFGNQHLNCSFQHICHWEITQNVLLGNVIYILSNLTDKKINVCTILAHQHQGHHARRRKCRSNRKMCSPSKATSTVWGCTLSDTAWSRCPVAFPETSHGCCIFYLKAVYYSSMQQVCRYAWHKVSRSDLVAFMDSRFQQVLGYEMKKLEWYLHQLPLI